MAWSTDGLRLKLDRFEHNMEDFGDALAAHVNSEAIRIVPEFEPETGFHKIFLEMDPPGPEFSLIIGESAHNLRSALDHLAWQLATVDGPPPMPESVQFPILSRKPRKGFANHRFVNGMRPEHRAILEDFQPYNAGHDETILEGLAWISNTDKHRLLHTAAAWIEESDPGHLSAYPGSRIVSAEFGREAGILEQRAEIGRVRVLPANPDLQMHVRVEPSIGVAFGDPTSPVYGITADGLLRKIKEIVEGLIAVFDRPGRNGLPPWP